MKTPSLLFVFGYLLVAPCSASAQKLPACDAAQVTYGAAPENIEKRIQVTRILRPSEINAAGTRVNSSQGTRWFIEVDPNYMNAGPWNTTLYVGSAGSPKPYLVTSFRDHANTFSAHWINEELLFIQVWWGRIASTDLILDVTAGRFIYDKLANYGQTVKPCSQKNEQK